MFRKPKQDALPPAKPVEPDPRKEGHDLIHQLLRRIDSLDESALDPWELALKRLRQMTMLRCFGKYRTNAAWIASRKDWHG